MDKGKEFEIIYEHKQEAIKLMLEMYYEIEYLKDRIEVLRKQKDYYKEIILEMRKANNNE